MAEYHETLELAKRVLDRPNADPDDELAMLARQFLRCVDRNRCMQTGPNGKRYKLGIGLIHTKFPSGKPALIKIIQEEDTISLAGGEEFTTLFLPE